MDDLGMSEQMGGEKPTAKSSPPSPHTDMLAKLHRQDMAQYNMIAQADTLAREIRSELDSLVDKGEAISDDDVLDSMARLVGKGADPQQLGSLMAGGGSTPPMPQGGPGLAAWVQQMDMMLTQKEEALQGPLAQARLKALSSAVHILVNHHVATSSSSNSKGSPNGGARSRPQLGPAGPSAPGLV